MKRFSKKLFRPARVFLLLALNLVLLGLSAENAAARSCAPDPAAVYENTLRRGINLPFLTPGENVYRLPTAKLRELKDLGFDFVRLPLSGKWLLPFENEEEMLAILNCYAVDILNNNLNIVVDFHPNDEMKLLAAEKNVDILLAKLEGVWTMLAPALLDLPKDRVYLSLLNEPSSKIRNWWEIQGQLITELRKTYPDFTFVATGPTGGWGGLRGKIPYPDKDVIYDFHFYQPMFFTHHNAPWTNPPPDPREETGGILYPSTLETDNDSTYRKMQDYRQGTWNKEKLAGILESEPLAWHKKTGAKVACLEFGVYKPFVDPASRARWLKDVREIFEAHDIPWAMWDYNANFGLYDKRSGKLDTESAAALGLHVPK